MCSNFRSSVFHGSYFHGLVMGRENQENLDRVKILRYTILLVGVAMCTWAVERNEVALTLPTQMYSQ